MAVDRGLPTSLSDRADSTSPDRPAPFRVLTQNLFTAVLEPLRFTDQRKRLRQWLPLLVSACGGQVDVFVLTEAMAPSLVEDLLKPLAQHGWPYCTRALSGSPAQGQLTTGGVVLCSRWPLLAQHQHVFEARRGSCSLSAKGVVHCTVLRHGRAVHVIGAHLQAWDTVADREVRQAQALEIRQLVNTLALPAHEPVVLAGDFNIDREAQFFDLQAFLTVTSLSLPPLVGPLRKTLARQNPLYGLDDITQYRTHDYPLGCAAEYATTRQCPCCPEAWVDYVGTLRTHLVPDHAQMEAIAFTVAPYTLQVALDATQDGVTTLTDHYAVLGTFTFPPPPPHTGDDEWISHPRLTARQRRRRLRWQRQPQCPELPRIHERRAVLVVFVALVLLALLLGALWRRFGLPHLRRHVFSCPAHR